MNLGGLIKPEYLCQPRNIFRRMRARKLRQGAVPMRVRTWCGFDMNVQPGEVIGESLCSFGVYDLVEAEMTWRLLVSGDVALDLGANIGFSTLLMALRVGEGGRVEAFEPMPEVYKDLQANVKLFEQTHRGGKITLHPVAVSDKAGVATFVLPSFFARNRGIGHLAHVPPTAEESGFPVELVRLDDVLKDAPRVALMKVDVEGHEAAVFAGAEAMLKSGRIQTIIFEENSPYPAPSHRVLEQLGYSIFRLWKHFFGPALLPRDTPLNSPWEPPNYIATKDVATIQATAAKRGWNVL